MTCFYQLPDGRLFCLAERINAGAKDWLLKGWAAGDPFPHYIMEREAKPMPGAPMPGLRLVDAAD